MRRLPVFASCAAVLAAAAALAHHHGGQVFDPSKPVKLEGKVTALEWEDPHVHVDVDAAGAAWEFETGSIAALRLQGWEREHVKAGDAVVIEGFQARDGSRTAVITSLRHADGRVVYDPRAKAGAPPPPPPEAAPPAPPDATPPAPPPPGPAPPTPPAPAPQSSCSCISQTFE